MPTRSLPIGLVRPLVPTGHRKWYVQIDALVETIDESGTPVVSWSALAFDWMEKRGLNATERYMSDQIAARFYTRWVMPFRLTMDPDTLDIPKTRRLVYQGRAYDIERAQILDLLEQQIELVTVAATDVEELGRRGLR
jgi:head-tail adaptor